MFLDILESWDIILQLWCSWLALIQLGSWWKMPSKFGVSCWKILCEISLSVGNLTTLNLEVLHSISLNPFIFWESITKNKVVVWSKTFHLIIGAKQMVAWITSYDLGKLDSWTWFLGYLVKFSNSSSLPLLQVTLISWLNLDQMQL